MNAAESISDWLVAKRLPLLVLGLVLMAAALLGSRKYEFDQSIESMFAENDPTLLSYQKLKRTFGGNKIVLAVYDDPALLTEAGIERLSSIGSRIEAVPHLDGAFALDDPLGPMIVADDNALAQKTRKLFEGTTHSADGNLAAIACILSESCEPDDELEAIAALRKIMQALPNLPDGFVTGEPVIVADGFRLITRDGNRLAIGSALLLAITIGLFFRRLRWILIPVIVVQAVLLFTNSAIALAGIRMTMISSVLNSVAMVITVATMVHFIVRFEKLRRDGATGHEALGETLRQLAAPVFWALATDAAGFAALMTANVGPIHDYGLVMTLAVCMVLCASILLLPGLATLWASDRSSSDSSGPVAKESLLERLTALATTQPVRVCVAVLSISIVSLLGLRFLEVETDFTRNFRRDSDIVRGYEVVESRLGGAGVCEVLLPAPQTLSWEFLKRVEAMQNELRSKLQPGAGLTKVISLVDGLALAKLPVMDSMPEMMQNAALQTALGFLNAKMPAFFGSMYGTDPDSNQRYFRVILRALERQPAANKKALIGQIESIVDSHFREAEVTGFYVLLSNLIDSVLRDQRVSFSIAIVGIIAVMACAFRSLKLAVLALLPNLLPIIFVTGCMGWLSAAGLPVKTNLGVALIAAVSLGLSVDGTIHYVVAYLRARWTTISRQDAIKQASGSVGKALIVSTFALVAGFAVLCFSDFMPTVYFGALVSLAMLGGLLGNLVLLPALLSVFERADDST